MVLMRANPLRRQVGGGWAMEINNFFGPKWHRTKRVPFGAQQIRDWIAFFKSNDKVTMALLSFGWQAHESGTFRRPQIRYTVLRVSKRGEVW